MKFIVKFLCVHTAFFSLSCPEKFLFSGCLVFFFNFHECKRTCVLTFLCHNNVSCFFEMQNL